MPLFLAPLLEGLVALLSRLVFSRIGQWLVTALIFFGLEMASYSVGVQPLRSTIQSHLSGLPADLLAWMGVLKIDQYVTVICSAYLAAVTRKVFLRRKA